MKDKQNLDVNKEKHAPGTGSDRIHPETPRKDDKKNIQDNPSKQNTG